MGAGAGMRVLLPAVGDQAVERGDADVGGRVPRNREPGALEPLEDPRAIVVVDRAEIETGALAARLVQMVPRSPVALDHFADPMIDASRM